MRALVYRVWPVGEHALVLRSKDGRYEKRVSVEVNPNRNAVYRFMLRREDEVPGWSPALTPDGGLLGRPDD